MFNPNDWRKQVSRVLQIFVCLFCFGIGAAVGQTVPQTLRTGISVRPITQLAGTPVRIAHDPISGDLFYLSLNGDIYRLAAPFVGLGSVRLYSSADHGISSNVLGFTIAEDGRFFLVGSRPQGAMNSGVVARGTPDGNGGHTWAEVAITEPYPTSGNQFDHNYNGIVVSPDGLDLYVNSGSRTDHGEVQSNAGQFPGVREIPLTSAILRIPSTATGLVLPADQESLISQGYLFADGVRNSFDLAFNAEGDLFATENSGDRDDPDEINWIREGHHYGFPWRLGGNAMPQQFPDYDPDQDLLLPSSAYAVVNGYYHNDPQYPAPPTGTVFTEGIRNLGPDAIRYRNPSDGSIQDGTDDATFLSSFTPHRSPLGLLFDTDRVVGGAYKGKAFMLSWTAPSDALLGPFGDEGNDLLMLDLQKTGGDYESTTDRIIKQFNNPIDAVFIGDQMYVMDFGGNKQLWRVSFPNNTSTEYSFTGAAEYDIHVYPDPAADRVTLSVRVEQTTRARLEIYNVIGQKLEIGDETDHVFEGRSDISVDVSSWPVGAYFVRFGGIDGSRFETKSFVVAR